MSDFLDQHVGELLSGFIDGELTQQQRQRVAIHCEACAECRKTLAGLRDQREAIGRSRLGEYGEDKWREMMNDTTVKATRGIGWLLLIGSVLALGAIGIYEFWTSPGEALHIKLIVTALYGGLAVLLVSVLRQRLIERKSDKYKDVEI
jgi:hypothetical protein